MVKKRASDKCDKMARATHRHPPLFPSLFRSPSLPHLPLSLSLSPSLPLPRSLSFFYFLSLSLFLSLSSPPPSLSLLFLFSLPISPLSLSLGLSRAVVPEASSASSRAQPCSRGVCVGCAGLQAPRAAAALLSLTKHDS